MDTNKNVRLSTKRVPKGFRIVHTYRKNFRTRVPVAVPKKVRDEANGEAIDSEKIRWKAKCVQAHQFKLMRVAGDCKKCKTVDYEEIGYVDLILTDYGFWETHSWIDEDWRHVGFGIDLYERAFQYALKNGLEARSSIVPSPSAVRVWKSRSMNSRFKIKKTKRRFVVIDSKNV